MSDLQWRALSDDRLSRSSEEESTTRSDQWRTRSNRRSRCLHSTYCVSFFHSFSTALNVLFSAIWKSYPIRSRWSVRPTFERSPPKNCSIVCPTCTTCRTTWNSSTKWFVFGERDLSTIVLIDWALFSSASGANDPFWKHRTSTNVWLWPNVSSRWPFEPMRRRTSLLCSRSSLVVSSI